jgi:hypothetical protein
MYKNLMINERLIIALKILNKIKIFKSKDLARLLNILTWKETLEKTVISKLLKLKNKWFVVDLKNEMIWQQIFSLSNKKKFLKEIEEIIWERIIWGNITFTNQNFNHEIMIWKCLIYLADKLKQKWKNISISNITSQYQIQECYSQESQKTQSKYSTSNFMIWDLLLYVDWIKSSIVAECELSNSYKKFKCKIQWYKQMLYNLDNKYSLANHFYKESIHLFIFVQDYKIVNYKKIINDSWIESFDNINIRVIPIESL